MGWDRDRYSMPAVQGNAGTFVGVAMILVNESFYRQNCAWALNREGIGISVINILRGEKEKMSNINAF